MIRLLAAALLLSAVAMPAFACDWNKSAATDNRSSTVAAQPTDDQTTPPPSTAKSDTHVPSS